MAFIKENLNVEDICVGFFKVPGQKSYKQGLKDGISSCQPRISELEALVEKYKPALNLFRVDKLEKYKIEGYSSFDVQTGSFRYDYVELSNDKTIGDLFPDVEVGKTYTLSFEVVEEGIDTNWTPMYSTDIYFGNNTGTSIWGSGYVTNTFTIEYSLDEIFRISPAQYEIPEIWMPMRATLYFKNVMLNEGTEALPFEPCVKQK